MKYEFIKGLSEAGVPHHADSESTPSPQRLMNEASTPATVASMREGFREHVDHCIALVWIRRLAFAAAVIFGAQMVAVFVLVSWGRVILREEFSRAQREVAASSRPWGISSAHAAETTAPPEAQK
jgi:hypothetical protein